MLGHSCRICSLSVGLDPGFSEALKCRYKGPRDLEVLAAQLEPISESSGSPTDLVFYMSLVNIGRKSGRSWPGSWVLASVKC